ncbi:zinc-binding metallopeptidase family protein [Pararhodonellum marinum]|uniref:zinc-binding metallopeptidase family protein n=1 Tax=Pararhodonellum marinum TaxID=2755358 RepID=UPI0018905759|nr:putative zinc-binding peptidase [Pararhodonellum marinum]
MQLFTCDHCSQPVYFDNTLCLNCQNQLGFDGLKLKMVSLQPQPDGRLISAADGKAYHFCSNSQYHVCNWVIPDDDPAIFCMACSLNRTIPDLSQPEYLERWRVIETAKHWLIYALLRWKLPVISKVTDPEIGLAFNFKSDSGMPPGQRVLTGHADGLITMNIAEADDVEREMARNSMDEVYRTVLGHFRHEIGHYYWDRLIADSAHLETFRELYGDESTSYQDALQKHYQNGAPENWQENYISAYATMHPWESWAETWAHYLHIVDTLETAYAFGITIQPKNDNHYQVLSTKMEDNAYDCADFEKIFEEWLPLSIMMNSLNRSMGAKDLYPFVINATVKGKLKFIHEVIHQAALK